MNIHSSPNGTEVMGGGGGGLVVLFLLWYVIRGTQRLFSAVKYRFAEAQIAGNFLLLEDS